MAAPATDLLRPMTLRDSRNYEFSPRFLRPGAFWTLPDYSLTDEAITHAVDIARCRHAPPPGARRRKWRAMRRWAIRELLHLWWLVHEPERPLETPLSYLLDFPKSRDYFRWQFYDPAVRNLDAGHDEYQRHLEQSRILDQAYPVDDHGDLTHPIALAGTEQRFFPRGAYRNRYIDFYRNDVCFAVTRVDHDAFQLYDSVLWTPAYALFNDTCISLNRPRIYSRRADFDPDAWSLGQQNQANEWYDTPATWWDSDPPDPLDHEHDYKHLKVYFPLYSPANHPLTGVGNHEEGVYEKQYLDYVRHHGGQRTPADQITLLRRYRVENRKLHAIQNILAANNAYRSLGTWYDYPWRRAGPRLHDAPGPAAMPHNRNFWSSRDHPGRWSEARLFHDRHDGLDISHRLDIRRAGQPGAPARHVYSVRGITPRRPPALPATAHDRVISQLRDLMHSRRVFRPRPDWYERLHVVNTPEHIHQEWLKVVHEDPNLRPWLIATCGDNHHNDIVGPTGTQNVTFTARGSARFAPFENESSFSDAQFAAWRIWWQERRQRQASKMVRFPVLRNHRVHPINGTLHDDWLVVEIIPEAGGQDDDLRYGTLAEVEAKEEALAAGDYAKAARIEQRDFGTMCNLELYDSLWPTLIFHSRQDVIDACNRLKLAAGPPAGPAPPAPPVPPGGPPPPAPPGDPTPPAPPAPPAAPGATPAPFVPKPPIPLISYDIDTMNNTLNIPVLWAALGEHDRLYSDLAALRKKVQKAIEVEQKRLAELKRREMLGPAGRAAEDAKIAETKKKEEVEKEKKEEEKKKGEEKVAKKEAAKEAAKTEKASAKKGGSASSSTSGGSPGSGRSIASGSPTNSATTRGGGRSGYPSGSYSATSGRSPGYRNSQAYSDARRSGPYYSPDGRRSGDYGGRQSQDYGDDGYRQSRGGGDYYDGQGGQGDYGDQYGGQGDYGDQYGGQGDYGDQYGGQGEYGDQYGGQGGYDQDGYGGGADGNYDQDYQDNDQYGGGGGGMDDNYNDGGYDDRGGGDDGYDQRDGDGNYGDDNYDQGNDEGYNSQMDDQRGGDENYDDGGGQGDEGYDDQEGQDGQQEGDEGYDDQGGEGGEGDEGIEGEGGEGGDEEGEYDEGGEPQEGDQEGEQEVDEEGEDREGQEEDVEGEPGDEDQEEEEPPLEPEDEVADEDQDPEAEGEEMPEEEQVEPEAEDELADDMAPAVDGEDQSIMPEPVADDGILEDDPRRRILEWMDGFENTDEPGLPLSPGEMPSTVWPSSPVDDDAIMSSMPPRSALPQTGITNNFTVGTESPPGSAGVSRVPAEYGSSDDEPSLIYEGEMPTLQGYLDSVPGVTFLEADSGGPLAAEDRDAEDGMAAQADFEALLGLAAPYFEADQACQDMDASKWWHIALWWYHMATTELDIQLIVQSKPELDPLPRGEVWRIVELPPDDATSTNMTASRISGDLETDLGADSVPLPPDESDHDYEIQQFEPNESGLVEMNQGHVNLLKVLWVLHYRLPAEELPPRPYMQTLTDIQALMSRVQDRCHWMSLHGLLPTPPSNLDEFDTIICIDYPDLRLYPRLVEILDGRLEDDQTTPYLARAGSMVSSFKTVPLDVRGGMQVFASLNIRRNGEVLLHSDGEESGMPCSINVIRDTHFYMTSLGIATQDMSTSMLISPGEDLPEHQASVWNDLIWDESRSTIEIEMDDVYVLTLQLEEPDYRELWKVAVRTPFIDQAFRPKSDERVIFTTQLTGGQFCPEHPTGLFGEFPDRMVPDCHLLIFERKSVQDDGAVAVELHRGYRIALVTIQGAAEEGNTGVLTASVGFRKGTPIVYEVFEDAEHPQHMGVRLYALPQFPRSWMFLQFATGESYTSFAEFLHGTSLPAEDESAMEPAIVLVRYSIEPAFEVHAEDAWSFMYEATPEMLDNEDGDEGLITVVNKTNQSDQDVINMPLTIMSDSLRIVSTNFNGGNFIDRMVFEPGELLIRIPATDETRLSMLRLPQRGMSTTLQLEAMSVEPLDMRFTPFLRHNSTLRRMDVRDLEDLHALQEAITGHRVLFDTLCGSMTIKGTAARMAMMARNDTAKRVRLQVVIDVADVGRSQGGKPNFVKLLCFFQDFEYADALVFHVKASDDAQITGSSRKGFRSVKLRQAQFARPTDGPDESGPWSKQEDVPHNIRRRYLNMDGRNDLNESKDVVIEFTTERELRAFCEVIPPTVRNKRMSRFGIGETYVPDEQDAESDGHDELDEQGSAGQHTPASSMNSSDAPGAHTPDGSSNSDQAPAQRSRDPPRRGSGSGEPRGAPLPRLDTSRGINLTSNDRMRVPAHGSANPSEDLYTPPSSGEGHSHQHNDDPSAGSGDAPSASIFAYASHKTDAGYTAANDISAPASHATHGYVYNVGDNSAATHSARSDRRYSGRSAHDEMDDEGHDGNIGGESEVHSDLDDPSREDLTPESDASPAPTGKAAKGRR